ncbi:uncharacterized protein LOC121420561 [Lytechinus variegatus]|uniref:uncharacterized protein LOC121420561 n=1 Tax=Lytechinus variegatus TaxID=7654 RepID=UPI001BB27A7E|nr:uncharacterized protein LOC121420561 [Lytechinus variegatus]
MARSGFGQILVVLYLVHAFHLNVAQIIFGDEENQMFLFGRLPFRVNESTIFDQREFRQIPLGSEGSTITSLDYNPVDQMVYWGSQTRIMRISTIEMEMPPKPVTVQQLPSSKRKCIDHYTLKLYYFAVVLYTKAKMQNHYYISDHLNQVKMCE